MRLKNGLIPGITALRTVIRPGLEKLFLNITYNETKNRIETRREQIPNRIRNIRNRIESGKYMKKIRNAINIAAPTPNDIQNSWKIFELDSCEA
jgi:hypothetical protein